MFSPYNVCASEMAVAVASARGTCSAGRVVVGSGRILSSPMPSRNKAEG